MGVDSRKKEIGNQPASCPQARCGWQVKTKVFT